MLEAVRQGQMMDYLYIFGTIFFTVYGQLVTKWQVARAGAFPVEATEKIWFLLRLVLNPWVISSLAAAFLAFLSWMAAMTRFELSYAYPFMSLAYVLVLVLSAAFFHEAITVPKVVGMAFITVGIIIGSRG
jgi:multidrug transporter EmrE-like cation transporter